MDTSEEIEETTSGGVTILSLKLLPMTKILQNKHGLRHGDYQRYRSYCARRLARLRKVLKLIQGERKKFTKKDVTNELLEKAAATNSEILIFDENKIVENNFTANNSFSSGS